MFQKPTYVFYRLRPSRMTQASHARHIHNSFSFHKKFIVHAALLNVQLTQALYLGDLDEQCCPVIKGHQWMAGPID